MIFYKNMKIRHPSIFLDYLQEMTLMKQWEKTQIWQNKNISDIKCSLSWI